MNRPVPGCAELRYCWPVLSILQKRITKLIKIPWRCITLHQSVSDRRRHWYRQHFLLGDQRPTASERRCGSPLCPDCGQFVGGDGRRLAGRPLVPALRVTSASHRFWSRAPESVPTAEKLVSRLRRPHPPTLVS